MIDTGNTAWILTSTMLVLLMSIPGIALFYGGLVRQKNVLSIIMQTIFLVAVVSILWVAIGYTWVFDTTFAEKGHPLAFLIGGFAHWTPSRQEISLNSCSPCSSACLQSSLRH